MQYEELYYCISALSFDPDSCAIVEQKSGKKESLESIAKSEMASKTQRTEVSNR